MHHPRVVAARPGDCVVEDAGRCGCRGRVRRIIEIHGVAGHVEVRERRHLRARQRDGREVVRVAGVGQDDRAAALDRAEGELHQAGLRPRQDGHLACRVELDAIQVAIARGDRLLQRRQAGEGRVAVDVRTGGGGRKRLDDVRRRPDLRVPAAEIDQGLAVLGSGGGDPREQCREVLLGKTSDAVRGLAHPGDSTPQASRFDVARRAAGRRRPRTRSSTGGCRRPRERGTSRTHARPAAPAPMRPT